jgi:G:T-mismatch repair DNA endonuclease (very short patch repair protein)
MKKEFICQKCGKSFIRDNWKEYKYCSKECSFLCTCFKKGLIHTDKWFKAMKELKGEKNHFYGKKHTKETKKLMSISHQETYIKNPELRNVLRAYRKKQRFPLRNTKPELQFQNFLEQLGIEFYTHKYIEGMYQKYRCDIFIPTFNLVIEVDGNYFHGNPTQFKIFNDKQLYQIKRDKENTLKLKSLGYKVLRIWESEIKELNPENFEKKLIEVQQ